MEIMEDSKSFEILRNAFEQQLINDGFVEHSGYSLEKNHINAYIDERVECAWFACLQGYRLAKAQAVPEGFILVSAEQMSQWGHMASYAEQYGCPECFEARGYAHSLACEINEFFAIEAQEPAND